MPSSAEVDGRQGLEIVASTLQQRQLFDATVYRQVLALDDARHLLGLDGMAEQAERDVRLERLAIRRRIERLVQAGQLGGTVGRLGKEMKIVPRDAVDQEPERPP